MGEWKEFEIKCTNYLNTHYGTYALFESRGAEDSTLSDIRVTTKTKKEFFIEVKKCPAQCGQFVLFPDEATKHFIYSSNNRLAQNKYSRTIIDHMNSNFDYFKSPGTAGVIIDFPGAQETFLHWIIEAYSKKRVKFFITNNFKIFPIEEISSHLSVTAIYRVKRSGSKSVGTKLAPIINEYINENFNLIYSRHIGGVVIAASNDDLDKVKFKKERHEYMFSKRDDLYEIRQLSDTNNSNVIFSVSERNSSGINTEFSKYLV